MHILFLGDILENRGGSLFKIAAGPEKAFKIDLTIANGEMPPEIGTDSFGYARAVCNGIDILTSKPHLDKGNRRYNR